MDVEEIIKQFGSSPAKRKADSDLKTPGERTKKSRRSTRRENELTATENLVKCRQVLGSLTNILREAADAVDSGDKRKTKQLLRVSLEGSSAVTRTIDKSVKKANMHASSRLEIQKASKAVYDRRMAVYDNFDGRRSAREASAAVQLVKRFTSQEARENKSTTAPTARTTRNQQTFTQQPTASCPWPKIEPPPGLEDVSSIAYRMRWNGPKMTHSAIGASAQPYIVVSGLTKEQMPEETNSEGFLAVKIEGLIGGGERLPSYPNSGFLVFTTAIVSHTAVLSP